MWGKVDRRINGTEDAVKRFVFLTYGFDTPTPEIMAAWGKWFASIKNNIVEMGRLADGREISRAGTAVLPLGAEAITGFVIVEANGIDEAQRMAEGNPYITSIRVYEAISK